MKLIPYYRVSTKKQVTSFDVQKGIIAKFQAETGATILAEYQEVESGRNPGRPELRKALEHAKYSGATIVVAKMDRLARNVHFTTGLINVRVKFIICDMREADEKMMLYASIMAQYEVNQIRERTRLALQFKKRNGVLLGSRRPKHWDGLTNDGQFIKSERRAVGARNGNRKSAERRGAKAREFARYFYPRIVELRQRGLNFDDIAASFNAQGFVTPRETQFTKSTISRIVARMDHDRKEVDRVV
jgi:DNA invertase Pin-like site-specific DNA recombinase